MRNILLTLFVALAATIRISAQEISRFRLDIPVIDVPQNMDLPYKFPSMNQSLEWSADLYELAFSGIDAAGDRMFRSGDDEYKGWKKFGNNAFKYVLSLVFSRYGSELPIPLGVWAHEEFHRSVLGVNGISSHNGNWLFDRWDGTVYGIPDETLGMLKADYNENLLYSYVAGVQYEVLLNEKISIEGVYHPRSFPRSALALYNAWYVWDYFRFSTSPASDSVKVLAPPHEDADPSLRDFAGSDLTAWVHDMFNPGVPFFDRDPFPSGEGVNRRIGYSDLSPDEQEYLQDQKKLSLLNFLNPSIFFINRIKLSDNFSFSFFTRYAPVNFGNDIALFVPLKIRNSNLLFDAHRYGNRDSYGLGFGFGFYDLNFSERILFDFRIEAWNQPESFFSTGKVFGGAIDIRPEYSISRNLNAYISLSGKSRGWLMGNPYLDENLSLRAGFTWNLYK